MDLQKLFKLWTAYVALATAPEGQRDEAEIAKALKASEDAMTEAKDADLVNPDKIKELEGTVAQLRKDLDAAETERQKLATAGLQRSGQSIEVLGYDEIMSLRRTGHVFRTREHAEYFGAIAARGIFGKHPGYNDMVSERTRGLADELTKDLDPGVSGAGAELVQTIYMADLIANIEAVGILYTLCDRVPLSTTGQTVWPKLTGELTATPTAVAAAIAESSPTFGTVTMTPVKWGTLTPIPNEFFRNPTLLANLGQLLAMLITRAVAYGFDNAMVNGDGSSTYGGITGILQDSDITAVTAAAHTTLATYDGTDVSDVIGGMTKDYVHDPYWLMSLSAERTLRALKSTTGEPLYERGNNGEPNTIDGYPYNICQRFPAKAACTADVKWGAFGDLRLSHFFGMLGGIEIAQSEHARFASDVTMIRGLAYADAALKDADAIVVAKTHA